jgi:hypothetical protein
VTAGGPIIRIPNRVLARDRIQIYSATGSARPDFNYSRVRPSYGLSLILGRRAIQLWPVQLDFTVGGIKPISEGRSPISPCRGPIQIDHSEAKLDFNTKMLMANIKV